MAEPDGIDRFISDLLEHVNPATYDGGDGSTCLIGQLAHSLDTMLPVGWYSTTRLANYYGIPERAVQAIYSTSDYPTFRDDLDSAIWMADYVLRHWASDLELRFHTVAYDVEQAFYRTGES